MAFTCVLWQWRGLIGPSGILPAGEFFSAVYQQIGARGFIEVPSLCWVFGGNSFIVVLCIAGLAASFLLYLRIAPAICLVVLWACYLSLISAGQIFFDLQWDGLLLECSVLALFMVPWTFGRANAPYEPPRMARYLIWWLLFRLMFLSGAVKIASGDPVWRNLTALAFHYQTQPLPSPLAWYANGLPMWFQRFSCLAMFVTELLIPFLLPFGRRLRHGAALALIVLQVVIALTGNYGFFNLLTTGICLTCLDDDWWRGIRWGTTPAKAQDGPRASRVKPTLMRWFTAMAVGLTFFQTVAALYPAAASSPIVLYIEETIGPFRTFNNYRLFAVMTLERPELDIQGSDDGRDWRDYQLPYKPGELAHRPLWVAPYQPQLDWMLWFAALGRPEDNLWVGKVCEKLLSGDKDVLGLFSKNPFPEHPPKYMRVVRYKYEFTTPAERARTGNWWRSSPIDFYISPVGLTADQK
ncbi:MAG TPA: lipase maturation factor family protein [Opitutaceae bacterium]|nr:lipase maturation factor family protein [Opitutaceae bacterium]